MSGVSVQSLTGRWQYCYCSCYCCNCYHCYCMDRGWRKTMDSFVVVAVTVAACVGFASTICAWVSDCCHYYYNQWWQRCDCQLCCIWITDNFTTKNDALGQYIALCNYTGLEITWYDDEWMNEMNGVYGQHTAMKNYTGPRTTWSDRMECRFNERMVY